MKKLYAGVCAAEAWVAAVFLVLMVVLIFLRGVMRRLAHPITWSGDAATGLFAWACFLCADIAWRRNSLMAIEVVTSRLPERLRIGGAHHDAAGVGLVRDIRRQDVRHDREIVPRPLGRRSDGPEQPERGDE